MARICTCLKPLTAATLRMLVRWSALDYELKRDVLDRDGSPRTAIVFRLAPLYEADPDVRPPIQSPPSTKGEHAPRSRFWDIPLEQLLEIAVQGPISTAEPRKARINLRARSEAVKIFVQRRADGKCEGCAAQAPFVTSDGRPYLEPHHVRRISDGGPDHPAWVIALCPTCHRRAHYARDAREYNAKLTAIANRTHGHLSRSRGLPTY